MGMDGVVVLEPGGRLLQNGDGIGAGGHADVVALDGFDEGLADAIALGAAERVKQATRLSAVAKPIVSPAV